MASKWTDAESSRLIEWYHQHEHLWNKKLKDYHQKKDERTRDIKTIADQMGKTVKDVMGKWHMLKTSFDRILKRNSGKSGDAALDPNITNWIHFSEMQFVKSVLSDSSTSNMNLNFEEPANEFELYGRSASRAASESGFDSLLGQEDDFEIRSNLCADVPSSSVYSKRRKRQTEADNQTAFYDKVLCALDDKDDDVDVFLKGLGPSLRKLDFQFQEVAKFQIQSTLFQLYQQQLSGGEVVIVSNSN